MPTNRSSGHTGGTETAPPAPANLLPTSGRGASSPRSQGVVGELAVLCKSLRHQHLCFVHERVRQFAMVTGPDSAPGRGWPALIGGHRRRRLPSAPPNLLLNSVRVLRWLSGQGRKKRGKGNKGPVPQAPYPQSPQRLQTAVLAHGSTRAWMGRPASCSAISRCSAALSMVRSPPRNWKRLP